MSTTQELRLARAVSLAALCLVPLSGCGALRVRRAPELLASQPSPRPRPPALRVGPRPAPSPVVRDSVGDALGPSPASLSGAFARSRGDVGSLYLETLDAAYVSILSDVYGCDYIGHPLRAYLDSGDGQGVALGYLEDGVGFGLFYLTSDHSEAFTGADARFHGAFLEHRLRARSDTPGIALMATASLGIGVAGVNFEDDRYDRGGIAVEGRVSAGLVLLRVVGIDVGAGYFYWGDSEAPLGEGGVLSSSLTVWL